MRTAKTMIRLSAQADLSLRWAHMSICLFCHALAHISEMRGKTVHGCGYFYWPFTLLRDSSVNVRGMACLFAQNLISR